jgi:hypothetical protein
MAVRAGTHAQPARRHGSLRALLPSGRRRAHPLAAVLEPLEDLGWLVLPGVDTEEGHIEQVAVGPAGVFTIESCPSGGRISVEKIDERAYAGPCARARHVEAAIGRPVTPVLVFPYAKLSRDVSRQRGVIVVMTRTLAGHLLRRRPRLTEAEVHSHYHQLVGTLGG